MPVVCQAAYHFCSQHNDRLPTCKLFVAVSTSAFTVYAKYQTQPRYLPDVNTLS